jgi:hypothetical protein
MKTLLMILMSISLGVGSTLLVQTVIVQPAPVVMVACPDPDTSLVEPVLMEKALEPLEGTYVPQGRLLPPPRTGRED